VRARGMQVGPTATAAAGLCAALPHADAPAQGPCLLPRARYRRRPAGALPPLFFPEPNQTKPNPKAESRPCAGVTQKFLGRAAALACVPLTRAGPRCLDASRVLPQVRTGAAALSARRRVWPEGLGERSPAGAASTARCTGAHVRLGFCDFTTSVGARLRAPSARWLVPRALPYWPPLACDSSSTPRADSAGSAPRRRAGTRSPPQRARGFSYATGSATTRALCALRFAKGSNGSSRRRTTSPRRSRSRTPRWPHA